MVRSQAFGWALPGSEWSLEFTDRQRRLRATGSPFASCARGTHRRVSCMPPRWLSDVTLRRTPAMPFGTLSGDGGWITEASIEAGYRAVEVPVRMPRRISK